MSLLCAFICCTLWKMLGFQLVFEGDILGILKKRGKNCKKRKGSRIGEIDLKELWLEQFGWHVWTLWRNREINYLSETLRSEFGKYLQFELCLKIETFKIFCFKGLNMLLLWILINCRRFILPFLEKVIEKYIALTSYLHQWLNHSDRKSI